MHDLERQLIDLVLHTNRSRFNAVTGFISQNDTIVTYDNFLYCLALFRTKTHDNVIEAKKLLDHLLYFQQKDALLGSFGNYPVLISDYPYCHDHLQGLRILYVKLWIRTEFWPILGQELRNRLAEAIEHAEAFLHKVAAEVKFPVWAKIKLASSLAIEPFDLADQSDLRTWGDPGALAEIITAYQLQAKGHWKPFWDYLASTWHRPSRQFIGPAYKLGSQNDLLHCQMGLFTGKLPQLEIYPLAASLLQINNQFSERVPACKIDGTSDRFTWQVVQESEYAFSTLTGKQSLEQMPGFFPVHVVTGEHSLAMQAPLGYSPSPFVFEIPETLFAEEKEKAKALVICFNDHKDNDVLVDGIKATCFSLDNSLEIRLGKCKLRLSFTVIQGDGIFVGHISRANRSGLTHERYSASDVQVLLRAIRGTTPTQLRVDVTFS